MFIFLLDETKYVFKLDELIPWIINWIKRCHHGRNLLLVHQKESLRGSHFCQSNPQRVGRRALVQHFDIHLKTTRMDINRSGLVANCILLLKLKSLDQTV